MNPCNAARVRAALLEMHWIYDPQLDGKNWLRPDGIRVSEAEASEHLEKALAARGDEGQHDG